MYFGYPLLVVAPLIGLTLDIATHVILSRLTYGGKQITYLLVAIACGLLATFVLSILSLSSCPPVSMLYLLCNMMTYLGLAWCYFHLVNVNLTALRLRLMREILNSNTGLSMRDILSGYSAQAVIDQRIQMLVQEKHLILRDGRFYLGRIFFLVVFEVFEILKYSIMGRGNRLLVCEEPSNEFAVFSDLF